LYASPLPQDELKLQLCNFTDLELRMLRSEVQRTNGHSTSNPSLASARNPVSAPTGVAVRVPVRNVDEITLAGQGLLDETIAALDLALSAISDKSTRSELEVRSDLIRAGFADLKRRLLGLRMVPLGPTFARAVRSAKSAARHLDIEVNFETSGGDVHVDKAVAEAIAEPLLHILRNAVSHGIEPAKQREEIGKPSNGRVKIDAVADGDRITISVADDGRGIDWQNIARSAIAQGFVSASEVLNVSQAQALLFSPGFSTAETVSRVAGRGVGLDIVERSVNSIGGEVRVKSETNRGATFEILIPARFS
jgi:two-component system chemotaxis sensor kinase CheA